MGASPRAVEGGALPRSRSRRSALLPKSLASGSTRRHRRLLDQRHRAAPIDRAGAQPPGRSRAHCGAVTRDRRLRWPNAGPEWSGGMRLSNSHLHYGVGMTHLEIPDLRSAWVPGAGRGAKAPRSSPATSERRWNQVHGTRQDLADVLGRSAAVDVAHTSLLEHASDNARVRRVWANDSGEAAPSFSKVSEPAHRDGRRRQQGVDNRGRLGRALAGGERTPGL